LTEQTRQAVDDYIRVAGKKSGEFMFICWHDPGRNMSTRQYARLVSDWIAKIAGIQRLPRRNKWHQQCVGSDWS
jgi:hypothetical protein